MNKYDICILMDILIFIMIYYIFFVPKWSKKGAFELFLKSSFYLYFICVMYFTLILPILIPIPMVNIQLNQIHANFIPYLDIISGHGGAVREIILNIIMFIPFGIMLPFIYRHSFLYTLINSFLFSLCIETTQLLSVRHISSCDVTDLIDNVLGAIIGYVIYLIFHKIIETVLKKLFSNQPIKTFQVSKRFKKVFIAILIIYWFVRTLFI